MAMAAAPRRKGRAPKRQTKGPQLGTLLVWMCLQPILLEMVQRLWPALADPGTHSQGGTQSSSDPDASVFQVDQWSTKDFWLDPGDDPGDHSWQRKRQDPAIAKYQWHSEGTSASNCSPGSPRVIQPRRGGYPCGLESHVGGHPSQNGFNARARGCASSPGDAAICVCTQHQDRSHGASTQG